MGRKRTILMCLVCMFLLLTGQSALGAADVRESQTDVMAGVVVDYMGKLQFLVTERDTESPIDEVSLEIYIPGLDRYVLFGVTDTNGILELDEAYGDLIGQFEKSGSFGRQRASTDAELLSNENIVQYRAYKESWLPYPYEGSVEVDINQVPQNISIHLYKETSGGGGSGGGGGGGGGGSSSSGGGRGQVVSPVPIGDQDVPLGQLISDGQVPAGIPKTGVEGTMQYWIAGLLFFLIAGGIIGFLLKNETADDRKEKA